MAVDANIQTVLKAVSDALQLDGKNNNKAAYVAYLHCIHNAVGLLLQDVQSQDTKINANTKKCAQLGQHCMDRIVNLLDNIQADNLQAQSNQLPKKMAPLRLPSPPALQVQKDKPTVQAAWTGASLPELPSPTSSLQMYMRRNREPSPMELATRKNQQLMQAYKKRMARISAKSHNATNISLSLQRQMAENVAIAKAREEALAKKMRERQTRLEAEAARRFASTAGMSKDEQERRHIYSKILTYEADVHWLQSWKDKLAANPEDTKTIQDLICLIFSTKDHPLTRLLTELQYSIYNKLRPLVLSYIHELDRVSVPYVPTPQSASTHPPTDEGPPANPPNAPLSPTTSLNEEVASPCPPHSDPDPVEEQTSMTRVGDLGGMVQESKEETAEALRQGEHLSRTLEAENRHTMAEASQLLDVQQFDDLYDDDDDHKEAVDKGNAVDNGSVAGSGPQADNIGTDDDESLTRNRLSSTNSMVEMNLAKDLAALTEEEKIENLKRDALERHIKNITLDVRESLDKLISMFTVAYEQLDSAAGRDLIWASLEEPFFKPLWPYLLALYRLGSYDREIKVAKAMTRLIDVTPGDLGVKEKFYARTDNIQPFQAGIDELSRLTQLVCPLAKLESIVRTCKLVCQSMEESSSQTSATGADDLLPVLCYVILRTRLPQLVSECHTMEEFIEEGYLMGEEGYCLTSLQTALGFVLTLATSPTLKFPLE